MFAQTTHKEGFHENRYSQWQLESSWFTIFCAFGKIRRSQTFSPALISVLLYEAGSCSSLPKGPGSPLSLVFSLYIEYFCWNFPHYICGVLVCLFLFPPLDCELLKCKNHICHFYLQILFGFLGQTWPPVKHCS